MHASVTMSRMHPLTHMSVAWLQGGDHVTGQVLGQHQGGLRVPILQLPGRPHVGRPLALPQNRRATVRAGAHTPNVASQPHAPDLAAPCSNLQSLVDRPNQLICIANALTVKSLARVFQEAMRRGTLNFFKLPSCLTILLKVWGRLSRSQLRGMQPPDQNPAQQDLLLL